MPGANLDAKTKGRVDPKAAQPWVPGGHSAVVLAAQRDDPDSIAMLAGLGADVDARDDNGATAMMHAAVTNSTRAVEALIVAGKTLQSCPQPFPAQPQQF